MLNSAIDKVEFFARFGVPITADQVPSVQFRKFLADNGELRNEDSIRTISSLNSAIEFVERNRPERKSLNEAGHRSIHRLIDNKGDGWTHGRQRERGEEHSAIGACWTWFEYMKELLRGIVYFNCHLDATDLLNRHPFRSEMCRDNVAPNRAAIHEWCVRNNRISSPSMNVELLRAKLLPQMDAVVRQNGVFLLRPDRGSKPEIVNGHRFSGPRAMELGWHTGNSKVFTINVKVDPDNLQEIWYLDEMGIHALANLSNDVLLIQEGTLHDSLALQDDQMLAKSVGQSARDQATSDLISGSIAVNLKARAAKKIEIKESGRKISKTELRSNISVNRSEEAELIAAIIDPVTRMPKMAPSVVPIEALPVEKRGHSSVPENVTTVSTVDSALSAFRKARMGA